jgi:hypothetical protein
MPTITVKTLTPTVKTSTPTLKKLRKFNDGDCPICLLPTTPDAATTITTGTQLDCALLCPSGSVLSSEATEANKASKAIDSPLTLEAAANTPCGHMFHTACLESWIAVWRDIRRTVYASAPPKCPYCRTILPPIRHVHSTKGCTLDGLYKNILSTGVWNLTADPVGAPVFWSMASGGMDVDFYMYFAVEDEETDEEGDHDMDVLSLLENYEEEKNIENKDKEKREIQEV